ncbi:hypothetical protein ACMGGD_03695 [Pseudomonas sp. BNK-6]|uniref:hypothetical protein n=1 Tax=unclassified Pseudomonas TaxID=196821 RepID=UPI003A85FE79
MSKLNHSVVHLTMYFRNMELAIGTGFIYLHKAQHYIITAWHNVTGRHPETLKTLSHMGAVPDYLAVNISVKGGGVVLRERLILPLLGEETSNYFIHPINYPRIDVVAIPFDPKEEHIANLPNENGIPDPLRLYLAGNPAYVNSELFPIQNYLIENNSVVKEWFEKVDVTDELFIPGYPMNVQDQTYEPVWKRATVASSVQTGWNRERKFLVDSASRSGMSGAPVLYYNSSGLVRYGNHSCQLGKPAAILAGIYVGRIGNGISTPYKINKPTKPRVDIDAQLGIVFNATVINEIIEGQKRDHLPAFIQASTAEITKACNDYFLEIPSDWLLDLSEPNSSLRQMCSAAIVEKLNSRILLIDADENLMNLAKEKTTSQTDKIIKHD